jgi:hypothetical protein
MADKGWKGPEVKGLKNNLSLSMPKHKLSDLYSEEKKQGKIQVAPNSIIKKPRFYPEFEILAAHYKGYLARREMARATFLFYSL